MESFCFSGVFLRLSASFCVFPVFRYPAQMNRCIVSVIRYSTFEGKQLFFFSGYCQNGVGTTAQNFR